MYDIKQVKKNDTINLQNFKNIMWEAFGNFISKDV